MTFTPTGWAQAGMWNGTREPGATFTKQQIDRMRARYPNRTSIDWGIRILKLKRPRERTAADIACCRPAADCFDLVEVACPVLHRGLEHDVIITPGGDEYRAPVERHPR